MILHALNFVLDEITMMLFFVDWGLGDPRPYWQSVDDCDLQYCYKIPHYPPFLINSQLIMNVEYVKLKLYNDPVVTKPIHNLL